MLKGYGRYWDHQSMGTNLSNQARKVQATQFTSVGMDLIETSGESSERQQFEQLFPQCTNIISTGSKTWTERIACS